MLRRWTIWRIDRGEGEEVWSGAKGPATNPPDDCGLAGTDWIHAAKVEVVEAPNKDRIEAVADALTAVVALDDDDGRPAPREHYIDLARQVAAALVEPSEETQTDQEKALEGLPPDLAAALQEPGVFVPQDSAVFKMLAEWNNAPSTTVSADLPPSGEQGEESSSEEWAPVEVWRWHGEERLFLGSPPRHLENEAEGRKLDIRRYVPATDPSKEVLTRRDFEWLIGLVERQIDGLSKAEATALAPDRVRIKNGLRSLLLRASSKEVGGK